MLFNLSLSSSVLLHVFFSIACHANTAQDGEPRLEITREQRELTVNIGLFPASEEFTFNSSLVNLCEENLKFEDAKTSCGCTAVELSGDVIPPGNTTKILFRITSDNAGEFSTKVKISIKDRDEPLTLIVVGRALLRFEISPAVICLSEENPVVQAEIKSNFGDTLEGANCKEVGDLVRVTEVREVSRSRLAIKITSANSDDGFWHGANSGTGTLQLILKDKSTKTVPLFVDSFVAATVFPKLLKITSGQLTKLIVFRRSGLIASKHIRVVKDSKEIAIGILDVETSSSKLSRYSLSVSQGFWDVSTASCRATIEESLDGQVWHSIGFVTCVFQ